jgi:hypothetical protein
MALLVKIELGSPPANPNLPTSPTIVVADQQDIDDLQAVVAKWAELQDDGTEALPALVQFKRWLIELAREHLRRKRIRDAAATAAQDDIQ